MRIVLGADHRGFALKEDLRAYLAAKGHSVEDVGASHLDPKDDYPDFAYAAALAVAKDPGAFGVLACGSGMGMDIVANKVKGVRATIVRTKEEAIYARDHDDVNIITLAADSLEKGEAHEIVEAFIATPFSGRENHARRVEKLKKIENDTFR